MKKPPSGGFFVSVSRRAIEVLRGWIAVDSDPRGATERGLGTSTRNDGDSALTRLRDAFCTDQIGLGQAIRRLICKPRQVK